MVRARAWLIATATLLATITAHSSESGMLPDLPSMALATLVAAALGMAAAPRRRGLPLIAGLAFGSQLVLHVILAVGDHAHAGASLLPSTGMLIGHAMAALLIGVVALEADRIVVALRRLLALAMPEPLAVPAPATLVLPQPNRAHHGRPAFTDWSRRGPPFSS